MGNATLTKRGLLLVGTIAVLLAASCSAHETIVSRLDPAVVPDLPAPGSLHVSSPSGVWLEGADFAAGLPSSNVKAEFTYALFQPQRAQGTGLTPKWAFAGYAFDAADMTDAVNLELYFEAPLGDPRQAWIGLADYARDRWDWHALPPIEEHRARLALSLAGHVKAEVLPVMLMFIGDPKWQVNYISLREQHSAVAQWPTFGHDPQNTRRSNGPGCMTGKLKWEYYPTSGSLGFGLGTIDKDGTTYALNSHMLWAISAEGNIKWRRPVGNSNSNLFLCPDETIIVTSNKYIIAYNIDGTKLWTYTHSLSIDSLAVRNDNVIYFNAGPTLYALANGAHILWKYDFNPAESQYRSISFASNQVAYIMHGKRILTAIDPLGHPLWSVSPGKTEYYAPAVAADGTVYLVSSTYNQPQLVAISAQGNIMWELQDQRYEGRPFAGADNSVIVMGNSNVVYNISSNGAMLWTSASLGGYTTLETCFTDGIVVAHNTSNIYFLANNGEVIKVFDFRIGIHGTYMICNNIDGGLILTHKLKINNIDNIVLSRIAHDGNILWSITGADTIETPPVLTQSGNIVFATHHILSVDPDGGLNWEADDPRFYGANSLAIGEGGRVIADGYEVLSFTPDGEYAWEIAPSGYYSRFGPAIGPSGELFFATDAGLTVYSQGGAWLNDILWPYGTLYAPAFATDGTIYITEYYGGNSRLVALTAAGKLKWFRDNCADDAWPVIRDDGVVYTNTRKYHEERYYTIVTATDPSGAGLWSCELPGRMLMAPAMTNDGTYYLVLSMDASPNLTPDCLYAVTATGQLKWSLAIDNCQTSPALTNDGILYLGTTTGHFLAIRDAGESGEVLWDYDATFKFEHSAVISDTGTVYVPSGPRLLAFGDS